MCAQIDDIVTDLKDCLVPDDMPSTGGHRPVRASGTRFVAHKVAALGRLIDHYGAYINHINTLIAYKSCGQSKAEWVYMLKVAKRLGCAFFTTFCTQEKVCAKHYIPSQENHTSFNWSYFKFIANSVGKLV